ncbi:Peptide-methionine (S)-S-oxide reductase [Thoreauomyces humboldtii]|nr:Peptide-methionine (S)-S-oxide reductase [Thoreauomyces humboldtii]
MVSASGFAPSDTLAVATFGSGCFWGSEKSFQKKFGAKVKTLVGYAGGKSEQPSYQEVCTGNTDHAEVVHIQYDPSEISYAELLDFHFRMHDPTTKNCQGGDKGTQYRSAIFYSTPEQKKLAEAAVHDLQHHFGTHQISTTVEPLTVFWNAEDYHQKYLDKNPNGYECATHFERTWDRIHEVFGGN